MVFQTDNACSNLNRAAWSFTVCEIMTPSSSLKLASDKQSLKDLLETYPQYDVIPILNPGYGIYDYYDRDHGETKEISLRDALPDQTSILDCLETLQSRKFSFVTRQGWVVGFIHYSDLNRPVAKMPFRILMATWEYRLGEKIRTNLPMLSQSEIIDLVGQARWEQIQTRIRSLQENHADLDWISYLDFPELNRISRLLIDGKLIAVARSAPSDSPDIIAEMYDRLYNAPAAPAMVAKFGDLDRLIRFRDLSS
ncbi:MAG TPA: hypothetical protein VGJ97_13180 [Anaerolineaceae bacterium]|jgi:hypothetical protein